MKSLEELLTAFASIARPEILRDHGVASCVASTWITIEVMRRFGISGLPMAVRANVYNAPFVELERRLGRRPSSEDEARQWTHDHEAWVVGVGFPSGMEGINAHIVALLDEKVLVDASIDQANIPEHGIILPGVLWTQINKAFIAGLGTVTCNVSGQRVVYIPHYGTPDFTSLYDWGHNPETDGAVERILAHLDSFGFLRNA